MITCFYSKDSFLHTLSVRNPSDFMENTFFYRENVIKQKKNTQYFHTAIGINQVSETLNTGRKLGCLVVSGISLVCIIFLKTIRDNLTTQFAHVIKMTFLHEELLCSAHPRFNTL